MLFCLECLFLPRTPPTTCPWTWLTLTQFSNSLQEAFSDLPSLGTCLSGQFCCGLLVFSITQMTASPFQPFLHAGARVKCFMLVCFTKSILIMTAPSLQSVMTSIEAHHRDQVSICLQALCGLGLNFLSSNIFPDTPSPPVPQSCRPSSPKPHTCPSFCLTRTILLILGTSAFSGCLLFGGVRALNASPLCQSCDFTSISAIIMPVSFTRL